MFSEKALKNAQACRFCWMCRHLCPVQHVTGKETNTPRAKGLLVSMMHRGMPIDPDIAKTMYECLLCGACTHDCATGFDPLVFIRESRTQALVHGVAPGYVEQVLNRIAQTGNLYGASQCRVVFDGIPDKADLMVWLGETARYSVPETANALLSILKKARIPFAVLHNEPSSGGSLGDLIGYVEEVRQQAAKACDAIRAAGAKTLVVLDSYDAALMRHEYADWGLECPQVVTAPSFVAGLIKEGRLRPQKKALSVCYHDASRLARDLDETQPARDILAAMGCEVHEMWQNKRLTKCCGSAVVGQTLPELHKKVAANRWEDAKRTHAKVLVAACPQSTEALSAVAPEGYEYQDLFVALNDRL